MQRRRRVCISTEGTKRIVQRRPDREGMRGHFKIYNRERESRERDVNRVSRDRHRKREERVAERGSRENFKNE